MEYCQGGDLLGLLKKYKRFDETATRFYGAEILKAVEYIHQNKILHRDLKPENICKLWVKLIVVLSAENHIKITDFGSAIMLDRLDIKEGKSVYTRRSSFVGTAEYCSPELLNDQRCMQKSDIWAIGCILFQMIVGM